MLESREYYLEQAAEMIDAAMKVEGTKGLLMRVMSSNGTGITYRWEYADRVMIDANIPQEEHLINPLKGFGLREYATR
jgi:hypothetical protein